VGRLAEGIIGRNGFRAGLRKVDSDKPLNTVIYDFTCLVLAEIRCFEVKAQTLKNKIGGNKEFEINLVKYC
jgi:hypothetical protein